MRLALRKAGADLDVKLAAQPMNQRRSALAIASGSGELDIMATMTSRARAAQLLPIRIPITKGLMGWRVGLLRAGQQDKFRAVHTLTDLRAFTAGQGHDWPDTAILRASALPVHAVSTFASLYSLLEAGRIDYFPRSITTLAAEARAHAGLALDTNVVLRYPTADYFFVSQRNAALAETVRRGLELALADGSFDRLFYHHFGQAIEGAGLQQRRIIDIANPLLSEAPPLARAQLWFTLAPARRAR